MMKRNLIFLCLMAVLLCCACGGASSKKEKTVFAMDTVMTLSVYGDRAGDALLELEQKISRYDALWRRDAEDSDIGRLNQTSDAAVAPQTAEMISRALEISEETDGAFDITVTPVTDLWGFYTKNYYVPTREERTDALRRVGYDKITVTEDRIIAKDNAQVDVGGIAKGYLSDLLISILRAHGVSSAMLSLGGNVAVLGTKPDGSLWRVAIQHPARENDFLGYVNVKNKAVVTSGGYQRYFEQDGQRYHHIIDPKTGAPAASGLQSVTIVSEDATLADGLSTAFFVMGFEKATEYYHTHDGFEAIFLTDDDTLWITQGLATCFESEHFYFALKK